MTVTYSDKSFLLLLFRWRGSVWKQIFRSYSIFLLLYFTINLAYRLGMNPSQQKQFEEVVTLFDKWNNMIPLQFLIGFYVTTIFQRWWEQLCYVAYPDKFLIFVTGNIAGKDNRSRIVRRTFARYANLLNVLVWKEISKKIKKRFPTMHHIVNAGLMTQEEMEIFERTTSTYGRWFVPVSWMVKLIAECRAENLISDIGQQTLLKELYRFRAASGMLTVYDWINIPLVYTQVVTLASYGYFAFCLISRQALLIDKVDLIFPLFTTLEFIFYIGWMKVGEELRCPFGEDDDDYDMNYTLDRNIHVSNMLVDELPRQKPPVEKDRFWDDEYPQVPHTKASYKVRDRIPHWRLAKFTVRPKDMELLSASSEGNTLHFKKNEGHQTVLNETAKMASIDELTELYTDP